MEGGGTLGNLSVKITGDEKSLQDALKRTEKDLERTKSAVGGFTNNIGTLRQEYRALAKESMVGKTPEQILETQKRLAALKDEMGDLNMRIKSMSGDPFEKVGEAVGSVSTMLAGATGAATLFGADQEKLNELTQKTIGLMAMAKAAQEASLVFKQRAYGIFIKDKAHEIAQWLKEALTIKTSTAATVENSAATTKLTGFKKVATVAQRLWNAAVSAFPAMAIIAAIAAIGAGVALLVKAISGHNRELKEAKRNVEDLKKANEALIADNEYQIELLAAQGASSKQQRDARLKQIEDETKALEKQRDANQQLANVSGKKDRAKIYEQQAEINKQLDALSKEYNIKVAENLAEENRIKEEALAKQREINAQRLKEAEALKKNMQRVLSSQDENAGVKGIQPIAFSMQVKIKMPDLKPISKELYDAGEKMAEYFRNLQEIINQAFTNLANEGVASVATAFGQLAAGMNAGSVFKGIGEQLANFTESLGKALVAAGIGALAFKKLLLTPGAAIAAGAALIAASAFVRQKLQAGPGGSASGVGSGSGGGGAAEGGTGYRTIFANEQPKQLVGTLTASGKDLMATVYMENKRTGA